MNLNKPYSQMTSIELEHNKMVRRLAKPGQMILETLTAEKCHLIHMCIGIAGELFELDKAMQNSSPAHFILLASNEQVIRLRKHVVEEFGDTEFYCVGALLSDYLKEVPALEDSEMSDLDGSSFFTCAEMLLDGVKRLTMYDSVEKGLPKIKKALAMLRLMLDDSYEASEITKEEALTDNLNKLLVGPNARFKEGTYSNDQAIARADKGGEDA
jgi:hypothetical protein